MFSKGPYHKLESGHACCQEAPLRRLSKFLPWQTKLKVLLYADTARSKHQDPAALNEFDIVLASYDILRHDQKKDMVTYRCRPMLPS